MKILAQIFRRDFLEFFADLANDAREPVAGGKSKDRETGSDLRGPEFNGCDNPCLRHRLDEVRAQGWRSTISSLETIQSTSQVRGKPRLVDFSVFGDQREIAVGHIEQFEQVMLNFDVVVGAGKAEAGGGFRRVSGGCVEFADEGSQIYIHD